VEEYAMDKLQTFPYCALCKHVRTGVDKWICDAFPDGIPDHVLEGIYFLTLDHRKPIEGDHGITFEPKESSLLVNNVEEVVQFIFEAVDRLSKQQK